MFKRKKTTESGQAIVLLALGAVVMLGFAALAIDGGMVYADQRHAQNAADAASLAAASAAATYMETNDINTDNFDCSSFVSGSNDMDTTQAAITRAGSNGYTIDTDISDTHGVEVICIDSGDQYIEITTKITRSTNTSLIHFVYNGPVQEQVEAVTRIEPPGPTALFYGNAVVALDPNLGDTGNNSAYSAWSNAQHWTIKGGGVFSNSNAADKHDNVTFPDGHCATAVGDASDFNDTCGGSSNNPGMQFSYPDDIVPLLPPIPACTGTAYNDGVWHEESGHEGQGSRVGSLDVHADHIFDSGVYCFEDLDITFHGTITGTDVTFYVLDEDFTFKINGSDPHIGAKAPTTGTYANVLMFSHIPGTDSDPDPSSAPSPCSQHMDFRGNGDQSSKGTIFMPNACIDLKGNSAGDFLETQLIGYKVQSNGGANVYVNYQANDNYQVYSPPILNLQQ